MKSEQNRKQKLLRSSRRVGDWYFMLTKYGTFPPLSTVAILHELRSSAQLSVKSLGSSCTFQMSDVNQESEELVSSSKLSATVPAFVPKIANIRSKPSGSVVVDSKLSPLVPEFKPSNVPFSPPYAISFYQPEHTFDDQYNNQIEYKQKNQGDYLKSKKSTDQTGKDVITKRRVEISKEETFVENAADENLTTNTKKKRRRRKQKEPNGSTQQQTKEELNSEGQTRGPQELNDVNDKSDGIKHNQANSTHESEQFPSLQHNSSLVDSSINSTEYRKLDTKSLMVSYSDKVKSVGAKNVSSSNHSGITIKSWVKDFMENNPSRKNKHLLSSDNYEGKKVSTDSLSCENKKDDQRDDQEKGPKGTWSALEDSRHEKLKNGEISNLGTRTVDQSSRMAMQNKRNCVKKLTCDNDDNWRLKRNETDVMRHSTISSKMETFRSSNIQNTDTDSGKKRTFQEKIEVDGQKCDTRHVAHKESSRVITKIETSKKQQLLNGISSVLSSNETDTRQPSSNVKRNFQFSSQGTSDEKESSFIGSSNNRMAEGDFPNLSESVKIKRPFTIDRQATEVKEVISSPKQPPAPLSYSAALRAAPKPKPVLVSPSQDSEQSSKEGRGVLHLSAEAIVDTVEDGENQKKKKKKRKKKKSAETGEKAQQNASSKRTEKPIQVDLGSMLKTISIPERTQSGKKHVISTGVLPSQLSTTVEAKSPMKNAWLHKRGENKVPHNMLDSTAPVIKRGKERETPARKKPSALKKIILKEREEKKKARETGGTSDTDKDNEVCEDKENRTNNSEFENAALEEDMQSPSEETTTKTTEAIFLKQISDDNSGAQASFPTDQEIAAEIHSRRFREYCFQVPDKEVDSVATELLRELVRFQDRQFHKDPVKAKAKRRFVLGLREVSKHLKLRRVKCVIISSNVERIKSAGGLDDTLSSIIMYCKENQIPVVFALKRQLLGKVLLKKVPVSICGIFNYDGAQDQFKKLIELTQKTKQAYSEKWQETREKLEQSHRESTADAKLDSAGEGEYTHLSCDVTGEEDTMNTHHFEDTNEVDKDNDDDDDDDDDGEDEDDDDDNEAESSHDIEEIEDGMIENDLFVQEL